MEFNKIYKHKEKDQFFIPLSDGVQSFYMFYKGYYVDEQYGILPDGFVSDGLCKDYSLATKEDVGKLRILVRKQRDKLLAQMSDTYRLEDMMELEYPSMSIEEKLAYIEAMRDNND